MTVPLIVISIVISQSPLNIDSSIQENQNLPSFAPTFTPIPSIFPTPTPAIEPNLVLSDGWFIKENGECNVKFAIPPKESPYYQAPNSDDVPSPFNEKGRFWDFPRGGVSPNLLRKLPDEYALYQQAPAMYASVDQAGGYISSAVIVSCTSNSNNLDNQAFLELLNRRLAEFNENEEDKGMGASAYSITNSKSVNRWGKRVMDLSVAEHYVSQDGSSRTETVPYTIFATPSFLYEVRTMGGGQKMNLLKKQPKKYLKDFHLSKLTY